MPDNAGDRKDVRRREKEARLTERAREDVVRNLMSTTQGREFVWNILAECQVFHVTFNGNALQSAFNEGRRSAGLALLASIMIACPDEYINAQREANVRATTWERRSSPEPDGRDTGREQGDGDEAGGYLHDHDGQFGSIDGPDYR